MSYKAVGFDYLGVMAGEPGSVFDNKISEILGVSVNRFKDTYFEINNSINKKEVSYERFWETILAQLNCLDKKEKVLDYIESQKDKKIKPEMVELIDQIRKNGYKVGLLSNNSIEKSILMRKVGLDNHFDVFHISEETGNEKSTKQSFIDFAKELGVNLNELIFIDDTVENFQFSKELGFTPILFENYDKLASQLKQMIELT